MVMNESLNLTRKNMNNYRFEYETDTGFCGEYLTCAVNKIMAYDMLTEFLYSTGIDPNTVTVLDVEVIVIDEED